MENEADHLAYEDNQVSLGEPEIVDDVSEILP